MNTPNKGDILAERIRKTLDKGPVAYIHNDIEAALADYRRLWTLGRTANGFTLAPGQEWHRKDFTEDMLPDGWRPLLSDEKYEKDDEWALAYEPTVWSASLGFSGNKCYESSSHSRTRRPLPSVTKPLTPDQIAAVWVEWRGGPCPVLGGSKPKYILRYTPENFFYHVEASQLRWSHTGSSGDIIAYLPEKWAAEKAAFAAGKKIEWKYPSRTEWITCTEKTPPAWLNSLEYRVKPEPVMVELRPDDVPPGSALRNLIHHRDVVWFQVAEVTADHVFFPDVFNHSHKKIDYEGLKIAGWEINRNDGRGFVPCSKPDDAKEGK